MNALAALGSSVLSRIPRRHKLAVKARLRKLRLRFVQALLSYDQAQLLAALRSLGVRPGDSLLLHSRFDAHHGFKGTVSSLIDTLVEAVGDRGHLLMVSMAYRGSALQYLKTLGQFDVRRTPSMMGLVFESFRRRPDVLRSLHPTHPVLVRGPKAEWFVSGHEACLYPCGPGTPFERLRAADGLVLFFNVPFENFTFFHHLEHLVSARLPFALYTDAPLEASVVGRDGTVSRVRTYAFSPEAISRRRVDLLERSLRAAGVLQERRIGNSRLIAVRVRDAVEHALAMVEHGEWFHDLPAPVASVAA